VGGFGFWIPMREAHGFPHKRIMITLFYGIQISIMLTRALAGSQLLVLYVINQLILKVCVTVAFSVSNFFELYRVRN
jgi:hypothetical protein